MNKIKTIQLIPRLVLSSIAGLIIFGIGINATWTSSQGHAPLLQRMTRKYMGIVDSDIQAYHKKHGKWPASLNVVGLDPDFPDNNDGNVWVDSWGRPYVYRVTKNSYSLMSYGRDGKPGGVGLDSDISMHNANSEMPFLQAMTDPWASEMIEASVFGGLLTFFLTFFLIRPADLNREKWGCLLAKLAPTLIVLFYLTLLIVALDYPSGH